MLKFLFKRFLGISPRDCLKCANIYIVFQNKLFFCDVSKSRQLCSKREGSARLQAGRPCWVPPAAARVRGWGNEVNESPLFVHVGFGAKRLPRPAISERGWSGLQALERAEAAGDSMPRGRNATTTGRR